MEISDENEESATIKREKPTIKKYNRSNLIYRSKYCIYIYILNIITLILIVFLLHQNISV